MDRARTTATSAGSCQSSAAARTRGAISSSTATGRRYASFTYVGDVVRINLLAAVHPSMPGRAFNCASGVRITIKELADRVIAHYGNKVGIDYADWKPGDIRNFHVDNGLLKSMGFEFQKDFDAGLQETLGWTSRFIAAGAL